MLVLFCFCVEGVLLDSTGAEDSESCENRNGAASALLHIDESDGVEDIGRQRNKTKRRSEPRQVQTGKSNTNGGKRGICLNFTIQERILFTFNFQQFTLARL